MIQDSSTRPSRRQIFRQRLRPDPERPARVWMREQWPYLTAMVLLILGLAGLSGWLATCGFDGCPTAQDIRAFRPPEGSQVLDRNGAAIGRLTYVRRINVPLDTVPTHVKQAFIATEDRRFYDHNGLDWRGMARATAQNIRHLSVREGFSTITMQVARNTYARGLANERSMRRKLLELRLARILEDALSKDEILELYMNVIYLGNGTYGVEAASRDLFGKSVRQVTLEEAAVLAALPKGPSAYTPRRHPERARTRRNLVLSRMAREAFITHERAEAAAARPLTVAEQEWAPQQARSFAMDIVRAVVDSVLGADHIDEEDVTVYTTLDLQANRVATEVVAKRAQQIHRVAGRGSDTAVVQGAMVAIDPRDGSIRALVGGRSYERGAFNRAVRARRQPGSAFKPFVFAAAMARGFSPGSMVDDTPVQIEQAGQVWTPANYGGDYAGRTTMRRALMRSANAATVRVSREIGEESVVTTARRLGITSPLEPVPSIALGALEVTPLELVTAYTAFANGGHRVTPWIVSRIERRDGRVLWSAPEPTRQRVLSEEDAFLVTSMLQSVVESGTGRAVRSFGAEGPIAGKTGTTNNNTDVWFIGYTPNVVAGFWFGYDNPRPLGARASGGGIAAPAWAEFYTRGWRERANEESWAPPSSLVNAVIDPHTGDIANEWCPLRQREWFKQGQQPTRICTVHSEPVWEWPDFFEQPEEDGRRGNAVERMGRRLRDWFRP